MQDARSQAKSAWSHYSQQSEVAAVVNAAKNYVAKINNVKKFKISRPQ